MDLETWGQSILSTLIPPLSVEAEDPSVGNLSEIPAGCSRSFLFLVNPAKDCGFYTIYRPKEPGTKERKMERGTNP